MLNQAAMMKSADVTSDSQVIGTGDCPDDLMHLRQKWCEFCGTASFSFLVAEEQVN